MTRKDYVALAGAIKQANQDILDSDLFADGERIDAILGLTMTVDRIVSVLATDNPRFDRGRFLAASAVTA